MPAKSQTQFKAMEAAAHGKSTLGIPKAVGQEFAKATPAPASLPKRVPGRRAAHNAAAKASDPHPGSRALPKMHTSKHN